MGRRRKGRSSAFRKLSAEADGSSDVYGSSSRQRARSDDSRGRDRDGRDSWTDDESLIICVPSGDFIEWT